jgi:transposase
MVYNLSTTRELMDRLAGSRCFRRLCGWERVSEIPSESSFSRSFGEFSTSQLPHRVHEALIKRENEGRLVGHISRDSTDIKARQKAIKKATGGEQGGGLVGPEKAKQLRRWPVVWTGKWR